MNMIVPTPRVSCQGARIRTSEREGGRKVRAHTWCVHAVSLDVHHKRMRRAQNSYSLHARVISRGVVRASSTSRDTSQASTDAITVEAKVVSEATRRLFYRNLGGNSWRMTMEASGTTVLCDPWLVGSLTFLDAPLVYEGKKDTSKLGIQAADGADFVLLTQALPDHTHPPTLELLPKDLTVIASPSAARVAQDLGFLKVIGLPPGKSTTFGQVTITATEGALVGPPWSQRENGFILREKCEGGVSCYYEPHCSFEGRDLARERDVDLIITPAAEITFGPFPVVNGFEETKKLVKLLGPQVLMPLQNGKIEQSGVLAPLLGSNGSLATLKRDLVNAGFAVRVLDPPAIAEDQVIELFDVDM
mmetsp:Transcript_32902/g.63186  ORF Transcript_32902/g.63186 Transcript_32902/m.63186 type:complete len:361 (+) Transcript_32902:105-1187(+)